MGRHVPKPVRVSRYHRRPLLLTTFNDSGVEVSFAPGGTPVPPKWKNDTVACATLDANGREIPIPFLGMDMGIVERISDLPSDPPDGLTAFVRKYTLKTAWSVDYAVFNEENIAGPLYMPYDMTLTDIQGIHTIIFSSATVGNYTGPAMAIFAQNAEVLDIGLVGPAIVLGELVESSEEKAAELFIRVATAQNGLVGLDYQESLVAGWNKLTWHNVHYDRTIITLADVPYFINFTVDGDETATTSPEKYVSMLPWVWDFREFVAFGGVWNEKQRTPPFVTFPRLEGDYESGSEREFRDRMYKYYLRVVAAGGMEAPTWLQRAEIYSDSIYTPAMSSALRVPIGTLEAEVAAQLGISLSPYVALVTGEPSAIAEFLDLVYYPGSEGYLPSVSFKLKFTNMSTGESWAEDYTRTMDLIFDEGEG